MQPARLVHGVTVGVKSLKNTKAPGYVSLSGPTSLVAEAGRVASVSPVAGLK